MDKTKENNNKNITIKLAYLFITLLFAMPSIIFLIKNRSVSTFVYYCTYFFKKNIYTYENVIEALIFITIIISLFLLYFLILKYRDKIFKSIKSIAIYICIIAILFTIMIPSTSQDVYSYIANGWIESNYHQNPYYTSVLDIATEEQSISPMFIKIARCWIDEPVIYGPVWTFICNILTSFSFGNIDIALFIFKIASLVAFLGSTLLIYKITKKKIFTLMFALNPLILFEGLANVHNDIFLILFILLSIYFITRKKNLFISVAFLAIATGIKYLSILLLPFILIYYLRNETVKNRIIKSILYGIEFIAIIIGFYLIYLKDINVFAGIFIQQEKYSRSLLLIINNLFLGNEKALSIIKITLLSIFSIAYIIVVFKLLFNKNLNDLKLSKIFRKYNIFLMLFTFVLVTNFNAWYIIWLFGTLMWQKPINIKVAIYASIGALLPYAITYATKEDGQIVGVPYFCIMILIMSIPLIKYALRNMKRKKLEN